MVKKAGRPQGVKDPNMIERVRRKLAKIYDAQIRAAEAGSTEAARFCADIVQNPAKYPDDRRS